MRRGSLKRRPLRKSLQAHLLRVVPFDLAGSFLILKLSDPVATTYGARMPQGGPPLDDSDLAAIEGWIRRGAQDD